jgi:tetratricopeptide (TPR) repeat protein
VSPLDAEADYDNQIYVTALSALNAKQLGTACSYFKILYDKKYDKPLVYDAMYKCTEEEDADAAAKYLTEGRERYPDDTGLLFSEINHYLKLNKIEALETKLKEAIEKEPENHTLYSTLGNTYDNLYQKASKEGDEEKAQKYFDLAKDYYEQALAKKEDYTDAIYSIGALYYNKAAVMTTEMNALTNDFTKEGTQRYNELKTQVDGMFDEALPYFTKVEKINPSDRNMLIALKEIFARKNDFEKSTEFKNRLEKVEAGEKIEKSYFQ